MLSDKCLGNGPLDSKYACAASRVSSNRQLLEREREKDGTRTDVEREMQAVVKVPVQCPLLQEGAMHELGMEEEGMRGRRLGNGGLMNGNFRISGGTAPMNILLMRGRWSPKSGCRQGSKKVSRR
jgi:hypothetical protein